MNPLLIQAQRKLQTRIEQNEGPKAPQAHYANAEREVGGPVTAKVYTTLQLKLEVDADQLSQIDPGAHIDPDGHDAYSGIQVLFIISYMNFFIMLFYIFEIEFFYK